MPVAYSAVPRSLFIALLGGAIVSTFIMMKWFGLRADLTAAVAGLSFWMKFFYTLALASAGFLLTEKLSRPVSQSGLGFLLTVATVGAIAIVAIVELLAQPASASTMIFGTTWKQCVPSIVAISLPIFIAVLLTMRRFAPTNIMAAGAAAGLLAGGSGALVYGFHCEESTAPFVAIWYTLGVVAMALLGAILARSGALRW